MNTSPWSLARLQNLPMIPILLPWTTALLPTYSFREDAFSICSNLSGYSENLLGVINNIRRVVADDESFELGHW